MVEQVWQPTCDMYLLPKLFNDDVRKILTDNSDLPILFMVLMYLISLLVSSLMKRTMSYLWWYLSSRSAVHPVYFKLKEKQAAMKGAMNVPVSLHLNLSKFSYPLLSPLIFLALCQSINLSWCIFFTYTLSDIEGYLVILCNTSVLVTLPLPSAL